MPELIANNFELIIKEIDNSSVVLISRNHIIKIQ